MLRFIWKRQGGSISIYLATLLVLTLAVFLFGWNAVAAVGDGWGKCSALLSVAALGVATLVWLGEVNEDWEESLPKTLTAVFFVFDQNSARNPIMACINASLTGESDIRAMGQQIGLQLNDKKQLDMTPTIEVLEPVIDRKLRIKRYTAYFFLDKIPEALVPLQAQSPPVGLIRLEENGWQVKQVTNLRELISVH